jgi:hypothetical protein
MNRGSSNRSHRLPTLAAIGPVAILLGATVLFAMLYGPSARAYDRYSVNRDATNCRGCHGDFRGTAPYTSASDGVQWKNPTGGANINLHDGHRSVMLSSDCSTCHVSAGRFPTYMNQSAGGTGLAPIGCLGCHGRAEPNAGGAVTGAGLRQHHFRNGVTVCGNAGCHTTDSDPATFTTANEHTFPPFYFMPDASHPNKPANPCNIGGSEGALSPPNGLDNDGDNAYDAAEPECDPTPTRSSTWGSVKTTYR